MNFRMPVHIEWIEAKVELPEHRQKVLLSIDCVVTEAIFLQTAHDVHGDRFNVFITAQGNEMRHNDHPLNDYWWSPMPYGHKNTISVAKAKK